MPLIASSAQLQDVVERVRNAGLVALDTEFVWERTYYPALGLVQLALDEGEIFLLDAAALDLRPLGAILEEPALTKVLHDAGQDLVILGRATGARPRNVFDTQLAGGFVGLTATLSLQALVAEVAGVHLPKGATRTDWLRRPLSEEQVEYARADVRHLPQVYRQLVARLRERDRLAWALEELGQYEQPARYLEDDPRLRYRQVKGRAKRGFGGRDYAVLRELAAWREEEARTQNRPRQHVLSDEVLIEIARRKPTSPKQLARMRKVSERARQHYEQTLLPLVSRALAVDREDWPDRPAPESTDPTVIPRLDLVQALLRGRGEREGVDPMLVATRAEIEDLVRALPPEPTDHRILQGWRREFIGAELEGLLRGEAAVALDGGGLPQIVPHPG